MLIAFNIFSSRQWLVPFLFYFSYSSPCAPFLHQNLLCLVLHTHACLLTVTLLEIWRMRAAEQFSKWMFERIWIQYTAAIWSILDGNGNEATRERENQKVEQKAHPNEIWQLNYIIVKNPHENVVRRNGRKQHNEFAISTLFSWQQIDRLYPNRSNNV